MDDDGFTLHSRRRGRSYQEPGHDRGRANFQSEVPRYAGTSEEFEIAHFTRYGREEGLSSPGDHYNVSYQFPQGSDREKLYKHYHASTNKKKIARRAYENGFTAAKNEYQSMNEAEKRYYKNHTDGLTPEQHERLDPRAKDLRDKCESDARNRETFYRAHPHGYHTKQDQDDHYGYVGDAYGEYATARDRQKNHERYRSYSNIDDRRDQYGRHMPHC